MTCEFGNIAPHMAINYSGDGNKIVREFYIPVLRRAVRYHRLSGYFSVDSLAVTAAGLAGLITNGGTMRLVVGAYDVSRELVSAQELSTKHAEEILEGIGEQIIHDLNGLGNLIAKERLKALAWMEVRRVFIKTFSGTTAVFRKYKPVFTTYRPNTCKKR